MYLLYLLYLLVGDGGKWKGEVTIPYWGPVLGNGRGGVGFGVG